MFRPAPDGQVGPAAARSRHSNRAGRGETVHAGPTWNLPGSSTPKILSQDRPSPHRLRRCGEAVERQWGEWESTAMHEGSHVIQENGNGMRLYGGRAARGRPAPGGALFGQPSCMHQPSRRRRFEIQPADHPKNVEGWATLPDRPLVPRRSLLPSIGQRGDYLFPFSRTSGDSASVKTTISSPVLVLISW